MTLPRPRGNRCPHCRRKMRLLAIAAAEFPHVRCDHCRLVFAVDGNKLEVCENPERHLAPWDREAAYPRGA